MMLVTRTYIESYQHQVMKKSQKHTPQSNEEERGRTRLSR